MRVCSRRGIVQAVLIRAEALVNPKARRQGLSDIVSGHFDPIRNSTVLRLSGLSHPLETQL